VIQISLSTALIVYGTIIVAGAVAIWIYTEITSRRAYLVLEKQHLWRCVFCSYSYLDADAVTHSRCPQCHSLNAADDKQARFVPVAGLPEGGDDAPEQDKVTPRHNPSKSKHKGAKRRGPRRRSGGRR
jgi:hypothetical protein